MQDHAQEFLKPGGVGEALQNKLIEYEKTQPVGVDIFILELKLQILHLFLTKLFIIFIELLARRYLAQ